MTSSIDGLVNHDNVYYVEIGKYHSSLDLLLAEYGKKIALVETLHRGDIAINIYQTVPIAEQAESQDA